MDTATPTRSSAPRRRARRRARLVAVGVLVIALGAGLALPSCSGGGDAAQGAKTTTSVAKKPAVDMAPGEVSADSAGAPVTTAGDQSQHVLDALTAYVKGGIVEPLRSGNPATADFGA